LRQANAEEMMAIGRKAATLQPDFRNCFDIELATGRGGEGRATMRFVVAADGKVSEVTLEGTTTLAPSLIECAARSLKQVTFDPRPSQPAVLALPLSFVLPVPSIDAGTGVSDASAVPGDGGSRDRSAIPTSRLKR
jgi:hypothetical protein